ncbi:PAS domain S-box protein [Candidatus Sumerlaeota bacterium]|nr:PAS domain S-box protein [Candidatus Sumerlaeota bacterium]
MIELDPETTAGKGLRERLTGLMVWLIPLAAIVLAVVEGVHEWVRPEAVTWVRHLLVVSAGAVAATLWALVLWRTAVRDIDNRVRARTAELETENLALNLQIEERRRAVEGLRRNEALQRAILSLLPDLVFRIRRDGACVGFNTSTGEYHSVPSGSAPTSRLRERGFSPEILRRALDLFSSPPEKRTLLTFEYGVDLPRGRTDFEARVVPFGENDLLCVVRDVSLLRPASPPADPDRERIRDAIETTSTGYFQIDRDGRYRAVNAAWLAMHGYQTDEDVLGQHYALTEVESEMAKTKGLMDRVFKGETISGVEVTHQKKDGSEIHHIVSIGPVSREGEIRGAHGFLIDVTDRARSQERLTLLSSAVAQCGEGIVVTDMVGRVLLANDAFASLHGYSKEELTGRHVSLFHTAEQMPGLEAAFEEAQKDGHFDGEVWHVRRDGSTFASHLQISLLHDRRHNPIGMILTFRDMSEHRRVSELLRASRSKLLQVVDLLPHLIYAKDKRGRFLLANRAVARAYGVSVQDLIGKRDEDFDVPVAEIEASRRADLEVIESGQPKFIPEFTTTDATGKTRILQTTKIPFVESSSDAPAVLSASIDITDQKQTDGERRNLEARLQYLHKLESLGVLAGGIAHNFNNLFMGVLGNADQALEDIPEESPAYEAVKDIERAAQRAAVLSRQMLAFSGRGKFIVEKIDLSNLVRDMTDTIRTSVCDRALVKYNLAGDIPLVRADATQIQQLVGSLVANASEAVEEKKESGTIVVSTCVAHCTREMLASTWIDDNLPEGEYVSLEVADTGCGMDEATVKKIFDPFFTTKFTGRGLGLAASLGIVRGHKGAIKVVSRSAEGSKFQVFLPAAFPIPEDAAGDKRETKQALVAEGHGSILLIDDDEAVIRAGKRILERAGYEVFTASGGREGVPLFKEHADEIGCVLLDYMMPYMDGQETFVELRRVRSDVPVIIVSGCGQSEVMSRFKGEKPDGFIQKPFEVQGLFETLRVIMGKGSRRA